MADYPDRPGYSFDPGPPLEASRFLANKGLQPSFSWADVEPEEHAVAFAVAKVAHVDLLQTIKDEVQAALDEGRTFADFQKRLRPQLQKAGWWGYGEARDPVSGQVKPALLGTPRRLKTIYDANLRSARAAGQWDRIQRTKDALPYLEYRLGPSERHRPHHAAKEYLVLPADDPFWARWYPPNGWGCKCWVRQLSAAEAEERGISDSPEMPMRDWTNNRTGEVRKVPVGIDPGWDRNPGAVRLANVERVWADRLSAAEPDVARAALRDVAGSWRVRRIAEGAAPGEAPIAILPARVAAAADAPRLVVFNDRAARHLFTEKADRALDDLAELGLMGRGGRWALHVDEQGRRSLHTLIEEAANPASGVPRRRRPLAVVLYFSEDRMFVATKHRIRSAEKWLARARRLGMTVLE